MNNLAQIHVRLALIDGEESSPTWKDAVRFGRPSGAQVDFGRLNPGLAPWAILYWPLTGPHAGSTLFSNQRPGAEALLN